MIRATLLSFTITATSLLAQDQPKAQLPADLDAWQTIEIGKRRPLTVRLRVREVATLADRQWLALEFENHSKEAIDGTWLSYRIQASFANGSHGGLGQGNAINFLGEDKFLPPGVRVTAEFPSEHSSMFLQPGTIESQLVEAEITIRGLGAVTPPSATQVHSAEFSFQWMAFDPEQTDALRAELRDRLEQPRYSTSAWARTSMLLASPQIAKGLTTEEVFSALVHRAAHSRMGADLERNAILKHVNEHFAANRELAALIIASLDGDDGLLHLQDLTKTPNLWSDEFIEPLVRLVEDASALLAAGGSIRRDPHRSMVTALELLRTREAPADHPGIATRLSKAVLAAYGDHLKLPGTVHWKNAADLLSRTGDPAMVAKLAPFLDSSPVDDPLEQAPHQFNLAGGMIPPPFRVRDQALEAIITLLDGDPHASYPPDELRKVLYPEFELAHPGIQKLGDRERKKFVRVTAMRDAAITKLKNRLAEKK